MTLVPRDITRVALLSGLTLTVAVGIYYAFALATVLPIVAGLAQHPLGAAEPLLEVASWGQVGAGVALLALAVRRSPLMFLAYLVWAAAVGVMVLGLWLAPGTTPNGGWWVLGVGCVVAAVGIAVRRLRSDAV